VRNADLDFWKTRQLVAVFTEMSCLGLLGFIDDIHLMLTEVIMFDDFVSYTYHYIPYTELIRTDTYSKATREMHTLRLETSDFCKLWQERGQCAISRLTSPLATHSEDVPSREILPEKSLLMMM